MMKNLFQLAQAQNKSFINSCKHSVDVETTHVKVLKHQQLNQLLCDIPHMFKGVNMRGLKKIVDKTIPVYAIKAKTEKLLWHQQLGHPCNEYLYNTHKYITGVPKFDWQTPVLDQCPTCNQEKQTKVPAGPHSTYIATQPYQRLSIDFCFTGTSVKDSARKSDYEGINGETCWILVTDHFTGMKHGDARISKRTAATMGCSFSGSVQPTLPGQICLHGSRWRAFQSPRSTKPV